MDGIWCKQALFEKKISKIKNKKVHSVQFNSTHVHSDKSWVLSWFTYIYFLSLNILNGHWLVSFVQNNKQYFAKKKDKNKAKKIPHIFFVNFIYTFTPNNCWVSTVGGPLLLQFFKNCFIKFCVTWRDNNHDFKW